MAVQRDRVRGDLKSWRRHLLEVARALVNVEHLRAVIALEMVVMTKVG